jgi:hypothetical protein
VLLHARLRLSWVAGRGLLHLLLLTWVLGEPACLLVLPCCC